jgi:hypothetical protein
MSDNQESIEIPLVEGEWVKDTPAKLPAEFEPYRQYSDRFFSPLKQYAMAEKRFWAANPDALEEYKQFLKEHENV